MTEINELTQSLPESVLNTTTRIVYKKGLKANTVSFQSVSIIQSLSLKILTLIRYYKQSL